MLSVWVVSHEPRDQGNSRQLPGPPKIWSISSETDMFILLFDDLAIQRECLLFGKSKEKESGYCKDVLPSVNSSPA